MKPGILTLFQNSTFFALGKRKWCHVNSQITKSHLLVQRCYMLLTLNHMQNLKFVVSIRVNIWLWLVAHWCCSTNTVKTNLLCERHFVIATNMTVFSCRSEPKCTLCVFELLLQIILQWKPVWCRVSFSFVGLLRRESRVIVYTQLVYLISNSISFQPEIFANIQNSELLIKRLLRVLSTASCVPLDVSLLRLLVWIILILFNFSIVRPYMNKAL